MDHTERRPSNNRPLPLRNTPRKHRGDHFEVGRANSRAADFLAAKRASDEPDCCFWVARKKGVPRGEKVWDGETLWRETGGVLARYVGLASAHSRPDVHTRTAVQKG